MVINIKEFGKMEYSKREFVFMLMDEAMMENGKMESLLAMELKYGQMVENMKEIGKTEPQQGKVRKLHQKEVRLKAIGKEIIFFKVNFDNIINITIEQIMMIKLMRK